MKNQQEEPSDTLDGFEGKKNKEGTIKKRDLHTLQFAKALRAWSAAFVLWCSSQGFKLLCNTWLYVNIYLLSPLSFHPHNNEQYLQPSDNDLCHKIRCISLLHRLGRSVEKRLEVLFPPQDQRDRHWKGAPHWRWLVFIVGYSHNWQPSNRGLVS